MWGVGARTLPTLRLSTPGSAPADNVLTGTYVTHAPAYLQGCGFQLLDSPIWIHKFSIASLIYREREREYMHDMSIFAFRIVRSEPFRDLATPAPWPGPSRHTQATVSSALQSAPAQPDHSVLFLIINLEVAAPDRMKYAALTSTRVANLTGR